MNFPWELTGIIIASYITLLTVCSWIILRTAKDTQKEGHGYLKQITLFVAVVSGFIVIVIHGSPISLHIDITWP